VPARFALFSADFVARVARNFAQRARSRANVGEDAGYDDRVAMEHPYRAPQPIEKEWRPLSEGVKIGIVVTIAAVLFTGYVAYDQLFRARLPMAVPPLRFTADEEDGRGALRALARGGGSTRGRRPNAGLASDRK